MHPKLTQSNKRDPFMNTTYNNSKPFSIFLHLKKTHLSYRNKYSTNVSNQIQDKDKHLTILSKSNAHKSETSLSSSYECETKNFKWSN